MFRVKHSLQRETQQDQAAQKALEDTRRSSAEEARRQSEELLRTWNQDKAQEIRDITDRKRCLHRHHHCMALSPDVLHSHFFVLVGRQELSRPARKRRHAKGCAATNMKFLPDRLITHPDSGRLQRPHSGSFSTRLRLLSKKPWTTMPATKSPSRKHGKAATKDPIANR